jgi:ribosomal protein L37AE/L43A
MATKLFFLKRNQMTKPKCPECGSSQIYYRLKAQEQQCRVCGHSWKKVVKVSGSNAEKRINKVIDSRSVKK